jgi:molybdate transport system substrate-binding protein
MEDIIAIFTQNTGIACEMVVSSSGKLAAHIMAGAPYDVFVSADMVYTDDLFRRGWTVEAPKIYAQGQLVLWSTNEKLQPTLSILTNSRVNHIALANPKTAPYGQATVEVLKNLQVYDSIVDKLVFGESISQTNQFVLSKTAEIGFTAKSIVFSIQMIGKGNWIDIADSLYQPIYQSVVLIKKENESIENAKKFYDFLFSKKAREIFEKYGYELGESDIISPKEETVKE